MDSRGVNVTVIAAEYDKNLKNRTPVVQIRTVLRNTLVVAH
jgi:hypothetical protein